MSDKGRKTLLDHLFIKKDAQQLLSVLRELQGALFFQGNRQQLPNLRRDKRLHIDSVFQQSVREGKTEWVALLLAAEWEGKSSSQNSVVFHQGVDGASLSVGSSFSTNRALFAPAMQR